jgi:cobyrinic acid a,c-diamide synthase
MYLAESLSAGGVEYPMASVLPARVMQTERLQALGYVEASGTGVSALAPSSLSFRGHEFHYSAVESAPDARFGLRLSRGKGIGDGRDGLCEWQTLGGYTHAYFTREFADNFVAAAESYRRR